MFGLVSEPIASSVYGGADLVITGNGFVKGDTSVDVSGMDCPISYVSLAKVRGGSALTAINLLLENIC